MSEQADKIQKQLKDELASIQEFLKATPNSPMAGQMRARKTELESLLNTGGGAVVAGDVDTKGGDFVGRDQIKVTISEKYWRILHRPPTEDEKEAARQYLQYLSDRHRYLNFRGMGVADRIPLKLPLLDIYVPLKARLELPEGETWNRAHLGGRELTDEEGAAMRMSEPQPVLEILQKRSGLVILGDPGSGKTTFLKYLTLMLASAESERLGLGERLPILLPLSAYATALAEGAAARLDDFIADYFHETGSNLPVAAMLSESLKAGAALILLDGLDEVKEIGLRQTVVDRVTDFFSLHHRAGNKFVLTSRVIGYRDVRPNAEGLVESTLVDFDDDEIETFVDHWVIALEQQAQGETLPAQSDARREKNELLDAIRHNPGVRRLAANPLLLTILALMKRQGVTLPERRVELYDQYVRTLLSTWNRARSLGAGASSATPDVVETLRILAPLALWMHEVNPGVGLVKREDLRRKLASLFAERGNPHPEQAARGFLDDVREHAALLLERGPGEFGFIHLTFEEFLAAVAIALSGQGDCRPIVSRLSAHLGEQPWREVSLLAVSYLGVIQQLDSVAGEVVEALADTQTEEAVILAGGAVLDAWPGGVPLKSKTRVMQALIPTMQNSGTSPASRKRAGLLLGRLGWQPDDLEDFVNVPAGKFLYGDKKEERDIATPYWIARYPVTNLQFERFMEADGYREKSYWSEEGWQYCKKNGWQEPRFWGSDYGNPLFPVVGVSWYEAEAYCNWLGKQELTIHIPDGYVVRLPTEEEWERAARGIDGREYPWGDEFDTTRAHTAEGHPGDRFGFGTMAVCTFPQGSSPAGAWDMSGNVWEWNLDWWDEKKETRVLRGGSWDDLSRNARCASRLGSGPGGRYGNIGFRVVVSLAFR